MFLCSQVLFSAVLLQEIKQLTVNQKSDFAKTSNVGVKHALLHARNWGEMSAAVTELLNTLPASVHDTKATLGILSVTRFWTETA
ncbi:hypothetical protein CXF83_12860 [Shewanella sp. Choline-02u-19]|nr:hypothetical protein CXF83_12860 [Shewanella sp. Choline-02u-19]